MICRLNENILACATKQLPNSVQRRGITMKQTACDEQFYCMVKAKHKCLIANSRIYLLASGVSHKMIEYL